MKRRIRARRWLAGLAVLIASVFVAQHLWSISSVRMGPLEPLPAHSRFADVAAEAGMQRRDGGEGSGR